MEKMFTFCSSFYATFAAAFGTLKPFSNLKNWIEIEIEWMDIKSFLFVMILQKNRREEKDGNDAILIKAGNFRHKARPHLSMKIIKRNKYFLKHIPSRRNF